MNFSQLKDKLPHKPTSADPSMAFGGTHQTKEELARQQYSTHAAPPPQPKGNILTGWKDRLTRVPAPAASADAASVFANAPEGMTPFTDPYGNPVFDAYGKPVYVPAEKSVPTPAKEDTAEYSRRSEEAYLRFADVAASIQDTPEYPQPGYYAGPYPPQAAYYGYPPQEYAPMGYAPQPEYSAPLFEEVPYPGAAPYSAAPDYANPPGAYGYYPQDAYPQENYPEAAYPQDAPEDNVRSLWEDDPEPQEMSDDVYAGPVVENPQFEAGLYSEETPYVPEMNAYQTPYGTFYGTEAPQFSAGFTPNYAPPPPMGQRAPRQKKPGTRSDLRYALWGGSILLSLVLAAFSFIYACTL